ncbi:MAG: ribonuclease P protein subunit [Candidatus Micrarchaeota archaeon]|nr:ribonuclease P protein subunit [Candidatus Micrarchaeota archaeon]
MPIKKENLALHELIGLKAEVVSSISAPFMGMKGTVVDETKNTIVIRSEKDGSEKIIPKGACIFSFKLPDGKSATLDGRKIAFRPYDRPKKVKIGV